MRRCLLALLLGACATAARADVTLIGVATAPGDARDLSGLKGKTKDGTPHDRLGGHGSAVAYTGKGDEYVLVSDRGPVDGASDFLCRAHRFRIRVSPGAKEPVSLTLLATTLLTDEKDQPFTGALDAFEHKQPEKNRRFDPEGARVGRDGSLYTTDEYGPTVYRFDPKGKRTDWFHVPGHYRPAKPGKTPADELPPKNAAGRQPNRGMEGLAISPDGTKLFGIMQSPLIQDGGLNEKNERVGLNCRVLEIDIATKKTREFVYRLDAPANGVSEIVAVSATEFLVLERDGLGGTDAKCKKLFHIDLTGATDVSGAAVLPKDAAPAKKKLFLDLLDKRHGIAGKDCPEKFEGLAFGPDLPDGRRLLLVTADNDFIAEKPFRLYAFAVDPSELPNYQAQRFK